MLVPLNRHLVVEPIEEVKTDSGVLVPEGTRIDISAFKLVHVLESTIESALEKGMKVVVPTHTIEEVSFFGKTYYLVLENHVVGFLKQ
tara:strand:- start:256 stop:519 length:264 start_codon:yes stop_codon:yes gene_type:complete